MTDINQSINDAMYDKLMKIMMDSIRIYARYPIESTHMEPLQNIVNTLPYNPDIQ